MTHAAAPLQRMGWVDAAKGLSIILVVMMYSAYSVGEDTGKITLLHWFIGFATPFRMPEFFLISGLFLGRVIQRNWLHFADRRVVHYLYFYALWAVIHILFKTVIATGNPLGGLGLIVEALYRPYGVLWFIYLLAIASVAAKLLHTFKVPHWAGFALAALLQISPVSTGFYTIDQFAAYFVYFYVGYAFAPKIFEFVEKALEKPKLAVIGLVAWAAINAVLVFIPSYEITLTHMKMGIAGWPIMQLVLAFSGAMAICVGAALLSKIPQMKWLSWLGSKSLVVYLAFALPMSTVRVILLKLGIINNVDVLSVIVFLVAMVSPVILYFLIQKTGLGKFLIERPQWAHLPGAPGSKKYNQNASAAPAE